jgi:hypothetical protein
VSVCVYKIRNKEEGEGVDEKEEIHAEKNRRGKEKTRGIHFIVETQQKRRETAKIIRK